MLYITYLHLYDNISIFLHILLNNVYLLNLFKYHTIINLFDTVDY